MKISKKVHVVAIITVLTVFIVAGQPQTAGQPQGKEIHPGEGLEFFQLDLTFTDAEQMDSPYGLAVVDYTVLFESTGISSGYLNVITDVGWVIRNTLIDPSSEYPGTSVMFNLVSPDEFYFFQESPYDISSLMVYAVFSSKPAVEFTGKPTTRFDVGSLSYNAQGGSEGVTRIPNRPIDVSVIDFERGGLTSVIWQPGHPNIEQKVNQCGPAAVANCLQWMENCGFIDVEHPHKPGLRDDTLVGKLDTAMGRMPGRGVWPRPFLKGKLKYINDNDLYDSLIIKHKNRAGRMLLPNEDVTVGKATSKVDKTPIPLIDWIIQELANGEDVEIWISWDQGGAHYVNLIGGGYILGVPWIAWVHDAHQGAEGGTNWNDGGYGASFVIGNKIVCHIPGVKIAGTIEFAISQSPKYDPSIWGNIIAYPVAEHNHRSDLNNDGDTDDTILNYQNLKTGQVFTTGLMVSGDHHSIDIYENIIAFIGEDSQIRYYDISTDTVKETGATGSHLSIYGYIITFASEGMICYFDINTHTLVNTEISGDNPAIYHNLIAFNTIPEMTIWVYDLDTGIAVNTNIKGRCAAIYECTVAFETLESSVFKDLNNDGDTNDWVIRYFNLETQVITNTGAVGRYPALYGTCIVFTTPEEDVTQDLNGDKKILGNVIRYYDLETEKVVNTHKLGTEPDIYKNTISFYLWEKWTEQDFTGDKDLNDPFVKTYQITVTDATMNPKIWLFAALLVIGGFIGYFRRIK
ncbi:MAG: hypothetical protein PVF58_02760 [Candidatus Methanofastidiosia archaeon]|jgi:hypothetical protein